MAIADPPHSLGRERKPEGLAVGDQIVVTERVALDQLVWTEAGDTSTRAPLADSVNALSRRLDAWQLFRRVARAPRGRTPVLLWLETRVERARSRGARGLGVRISGAKRGG